MPAGCLGWRCLFINSCVRIESFAFTSISLVLEKFFFRLVFRPVPVTLGLIWWLSTTVSVKLVIFSVFVKSCALSPFLFLPWFGHVQVSLFKGIKSPALLPHQFLTFSVWLIRWTAQKIGIKIHFCISSSVPKHNPNFFYFKVKHWQYIFSPLPSSNWQVTSTAGLKSHSDHHLI